MNIQDDEEYCLVPKNVYTRFTFFEGFGFKELIYVGIGAAIGGALFLFMSIFGIHMAIKTILAMIFPSSAFIITKKDSRFNKSLLDLLLDLYQFKTTQQEFVYHYGSGRDTLEKKHK